MEYIQCTHCHKKYRVNEQVRAAAGRMIKCKDCGEKIEIVILKDDGESQSTEAASHSQKENINEQHVNQKKVENKPEKQPKSPSDQPQEMKAEVEQPKLSASVNDVENDKPIKKITWSVLLGVIIVAASIYGFFQGRSQQADDLHKSGDEPKVASSSMRENVLKPFKKGVLSQGNEDVKSPDVNQEKDDNGYTSICKEAAAQQWLIDFKMSHGQQKGRDYMSLLDQGIQTSALIRKNCGGSLVVAEVLTSAQEGIPPEWLVQTVNEITQGHSGKDPRF